MSYILNIETATKNCSVSLAKNGQTIICKEVSEEGYSHAEKLHVFIEQIIDDAKISFNELVAVAVSKGPGSYTGLRIGVSAAKGLCYALDIPLISIDTLTILAKQLLVDNGLIIPMIDARRMEVYCKIFDSKFNVIEDVSSKIIDENSFSNFSEEIHFIGDSNEKVKSILTKSNFVYHNEIIFPSSNEMSSISYEKYIQQNFEDVAYFEPFYLKDFMLVK